MFVVADGRGHQGGEVASAAAVALAALDGRELATTAEAAEALAAAIQEANWPSSTAPPATCPCGAWAPP